MSEIIPWLKNNQVNVFWSFLMLKPDDPHSTLTLSYVDGPSQKAFKAIPISAEPLHLQWKKSALHPSSGPPTDASCSCTLLPVCTLSLLSAERCYSNVGTLAEFKSGGRFEWSSTGMLAGCSDFHGLWFLTAKRPAALDLTDMTEKQTGELKLPCFCFILRNSFFFIIIEKLWLAHE